jgi:apolipoprotein D and lipocalin family protein
LKTAAWFTAAVASLALGCAHAVPHPVPRADAQRLAGTWYELARMPGDLDADCASDVTLHYQPRPDGTLQVTNTCRTPTGRFDTDVGLAQPLGKDGANAARLTVSFMPQALRWLPLKRSEWWVVMLDADYRLAVISEPDARHLRVLSRSPSLSGAQLERIVDRLRAEGYPTAQLVLTKQSAVLKELGETRGPAASRLMT